jgi:D-hydroxyproline dehydrogenase subunit gamma
MPSEFTVHVNGAPVAVPAGSTVAVAMMIARQPCRTSITGEPRAPLCGMGICFECRAVVNGIPHSRTCQILCQPNMEVNTDE